MRFEFASSLNWGCWLVSLLRWFDVSLPDCGLLYIVIDQVSLLLTYLQVEFMRELKDTDEQYRNMLDEKLQMSDNTALIQAYQKELGDGLVVR